ncbi:MAG TPA: ribosome maturation factor RimM [Vicinamibacteria bacterium]|nr:ribosome maturation factor RimM [Vicinamibacteria bacterium]
MTGAAPGTRDWASMVAIGRVVKPQGRKGEVAVQALSDRPDRFPTLRRAYVRGALGAPREVNVTGCWPHKGRFVLKLEGVDSIDEAEALRGMELRIAEEELETLPEGSYYHHQLRGLRVEDDAGRLLGEVADVMDTGAEAPVLVVRSGGGEAMVPLAESFIRRVDLAGGRVVVVAPGLVDI